MEHASTVSKFLKLQKRFNEHGFEIDCWGNIAIHTKGKCDFIANNLKDINQCESWIDGYEHALEREKQEADK